MDRSPELNPFPCPCGNDELDDDARGWIQCDTCDKWFHGLCANLSKTKILKLASSDWSCNSCQVSNSTQPPSSTSDPDSIACPACPNTYKIKGFKRHWNSAHRDLEFPTFDLPNTRNQLPFEEQLSKLKNNTRIIKRIPKGARAMAATKLAHLINQASTINDPASWESLFLFAYGAFKIPNKSKKSLTTLVKDNINFPTLDDPSTKRNDKKATTLANRVESKVSDGDIRGAIRLLTSEDTLAPNDEQTLLKLLSKHPSPSRPQKMPDPPNADDNNFSFSTNFDDTIRAISSFPSGSAGGLDGFTPQHLKDLTAKSNGDAATKLIKSLTNLCNFLFAGKVNPAYCRILYGARLCALKKKDGGIRPIAIGCVFRRLAAKLACNHVGDLVGNYLRPIQMGVKTRGGCEAVVHATRSFIQNHKESNFVLLKIDAKNAFNCVERDTMLSAVKEITPQLYHFLWQAYSTEPILSYADSFIPSQTGILQGDPCGSMIFSLTIQPIIKQLSSDLNLWYLDDGILGGPPDTVLADFKVLIERFQDIGLEINPTKCEIHFVSNEDEDIIAKFNDLSPGIKIINEELELLGSPLLATGVKKIFLKRSNDITRLLERLEDVNLHVAYFLSKHCLLIPKLTYFLRTSPVWNHPDIIEEIDTKIKISLEGIFNCKINSQQWTVASLPVHFGGLGIRKIKDISLPAFISSVYSSNFLVNCMLKLTNDEPQVGELVECLQVWSDLDLCIPEVKTLQSTWDGINMKKIIENLNLSNQLDKARYMASLSKESNGWLNVLPSTALGTCLDDNSFRIAISIRLGLDICVPHYCICGVEVNEDGIHGLCCKKSSGRHSRHTELNNIIHRALRSANIPSILEPPGLSRSDGKRPDGMTLTPWSNGRIMVWDATCGDTLAPSYINSSSTKPGSVAASAAQKKISKYKNIIDQNYLFIPFAVETLGPWSPEALTFINNLGETIKIISGEPRSKNYLYQRISIAIQRGNAACVLGTFPPSMRLEEIFYTL